MKKGIDGCFINYGIHQDDMLIIEEACHDADIDAEWFKEYILKPYNEARNDENTEERKLRKIISSALKKIQP